MEQRLSLITMGVDDLAKARSFYEQGLGWKISKLGDANVCFIQLNGIIISLYMRSEMAKDCGLPLMPKQEFSGIALAYNTRSKTEVDEVLAKAGQAGARILKPASDAAWGGYYGHFADIDGHIWEIAWNPDFAIDEKGAITLP